MGEDRVGVLREWLGLGAEEVAELEGAKAVATSGGPDISRIA